MIILRLVMSIVAHILRIEPGHDVHLLCTDVKVRGTRPDVKGKYMLQFTGSDE